MHDIFDPVNPARIISSEKPIIETLNNKNGPSGRAILESMDEGFCIRTASQTLLLTVLANRRDLDIFRKKFLSHTPAKNTNFWQGFKLPDYFPKEPVRAKAHLLEKEPLVSRLRGVESMRNMEPNPSIIRAIDKNWHFTYLVLHSATIKLMHPFFVLVPVIIVPQVFHFSFMDSQNSGV